MPHTVRTHTRRTASGRTVTVRQHDRKGGGAQPAPAGKNPKRLLGISIAAIIIMVAAIVTGLPLLIISAFFMVLAAVFELARLLYTPKVRRQPQREDWWDDGA